ncbi:MAG: hypothetical protein ACYDCD_15690 [Candidatus Acidiferrales bacterium]
MAPLPLSLPVSGLLARFRHPHSSLRLLLTASERGAKWFIMVYTLSIMTTAEKPVRQSVSLPSRLARRVRTLAKNQHTSTNRVLVELIESGIESKETEKSKFFELADQLTASSDPAERKRIKDELARMTFGE